jgi:hypothetical protein
MTAAGVNAKPSTKMRTAETRPSHPTPDDEARVRRAAGAGASERATGVVGPVRATTRTTRFMVPPLTGSRSTAGRIQTRAPPPSARLGVEPVSMSKCKHRVEGSVQTPKGQVVALVQPDLDGHSSVVACQILSARLFRMSPDIANNGPAKSRSVVVSSARVCLSVPVPS